MNVNSILVVCIGNICRSPLGERLLQAGLPDVHVSSAGLGAVVGHPADADAAEAAAKLGVSLDGHTARQFTAELGRDADLILVMDAEQRRAIGSAHPELSGKTLSFDQWTGARGIPDPHRRGKAVHAEVASLLRMAADEWISKLKGAAK